MALKIETAHLEKLKELALVKIQEQLPEVLKQFDGQVLGTDDSLRLVVPALEVRVTAADLLVQE